MQHVATVSCAVFFHSDDLTAPWNHWTRWASTADGSEADMKELLREGAGEENSLEQLLSIAMMKHDDFLLNRSCFFHDFWCCFECENLYWYTCNDSWNESLLATMSSTYSLRLPGFKPRPGGCDKESRGSGGKPVTGLLEMIFSKIHKDICPIFPMCPIWWICDHLRKAHVEPWQLFFRWRLEVLITKRYEKPGEHIEDIEANFREGLSTPRFKRTQDRWDILKPLLRRWLKQLPTSFSWPGRCYLMISSLRGELDWVQWCRHKKEALSTCFPAWIYLNLP